VVISDLERKMFEKLKVVELASVLAGPSVGQFFAELGAEVIKVENPETNGDVTRSWFFQGEKKSEAISSYFSCVNWGKKSALLDITKPKNLRILHNMIAEADIVIVSYKPGDAEKLKVDYNALSAINPGLIYGHITGYGGEDKRVGYDAVIQAESGFMSINGETGAGPLKMPVALIDILAAHHLKEGLLVALINRMGSGLGSYVPVALIDAAVSSLANQAANWLVGKKVPQSMGNQHPNIAPYGDVFETADGKQLILAVGNDRQFYHLNRVLMLTLHESERFNSNEKRVVNRNSLNSILSQKILEWSAGDLLGALHHLNVPVGSIRQIDEVFEEGPERWFLESGEFRGIRTFMAGAAGLTNKSQLSAPPQPGAHTEEIRLKYDAGGQ
jgi:crotonobetainyl-CoA:carnitine CoA-transferase CaiB-like acyl-CoA transferase